MARKQRIIGASRLRRKLKRLPDDISEELRTLIPKESEILLKDMQGRVPVSDGVPIDRHWKPGTVRKHLRDALEVRVSKDGLSARVGLMGKRNKNIYFFALFIEFGTKHMSARPFFSPSWNRRRDFIRRNIRKATVRALRKAAGRKVSDG